ncbi:permease [Lentzea sp. JNUCC 0626]|uniref:permease n=1 Tax=Lentzea sp. JNUCC 0626 TaxID=3367513 RepID=UPI003747FD34
MTITGEIRSSKRRSGPPRLKITSLEVLCGILVLALLFQSRLVDLLDVPKLRTASTVFVAICVQAMPFLVLGVLISGAIAAFVPASALRRLLPSKTSLAVPVAGVAGIALPGCECASVPVAKRLMQQGVAPAVALTFLLAAPAVNPIVLVSTAVAFNDAPMMVVARFVGSLLTAMVMGWLWVRFGKMEWIAERALARMADHTGRSKWAVFAESSRHDLVDAGGFLVLGGLFAAAFKTFVPVAWMQTLGGQIVLGVIVMALLAVILALCSEADAFVAVAFSALPLLPRLVFLVVGPAVDVKLIALQAGAFGKSFAFRFAPATFVVAILCAVVSGVVLL